MGGWPMTVECVCVFGREGKDMGVRTNGGMFSRSLVMFFGVNSFIYIYIYKGQGALLADFGLSLIFYQNS